MLTARQLPLLIALAATTGCERHDAAPRGTAPGDAGAGAPSRSGARATGDISEAQAMAIVKQEVGRREKWATPAALAASRVTAGQGRGGGWIVNVLPPADAGAGSHPIVWLDAKGRLVRYTHGW